MLKKLCCYLVVLCAGLTSLSALANRCVERVGLGPLNLTVPITSANIAVGNDVAVGSVIHRLKFNSSGSNRPWVDCDDEGANQEFYIDQYLNLSNAPALVPGWTGIYAGSLYQTSLPGVGVAFINNDGLNNGSPFNTAKMLKWTATVPASKVYSFYYANMITLAFVKTGPIGAGTITGSQLPRVLMTTSSAVPVTGIPSTPYNINFSGAINVTVTSCQTPDLTVPMGTYAIEKSFSGKGTATPWVGFNIQLQNCPAFYGTYSNASAPPTYNSDGTSAAGTLVYNLLSMSIVPTYGIIDSAQGIIALDSAAATARNVGIQLATGTSAARTILDLGKPFQQGFYSTGVRDFILPMAARYIQTGNATVTPGPANSRAVFTISYY